MLVSSSPPIVKLLNKEDERAKLREAETKDRVRRKFAIEEKEVQVSWNSAVGDLRHKLDIARGILEKGDRVQLVFAPRSGGGGGGGNEVGQGRKDEIIRMFEEGLSGVGGKWREDERTRLTVVCYWQAKDAVRNERRKQVLEAEEEKRKEKEERREARRRKQEERERKARGE